MTTRCKERVMHGYAMSACSRAAVRDGYCKQHHPETIAAKKAERHARWAAKWDAKRVVWEKQRIGIVMCDWRCESCGNGVDAGSSAWSCEFCATQFKEVIAKAFAQSKEEA